MKKSHLMGVVLFLLSTIFVSCSQDQDKEILENASDAGKYEVTIIDNVSGTRAISDQVQGAGRYPEGETVTLHTNSQKFKASARGSASGDWNQSSPDIRAVLTSGINQDWTVTIKYYCDVTLDSSAPGGDGTIKTVALEIGSTLPTPATSSGYNFEGWYDGSTKVEKVPDCSNRTLTAKFVQNNSKYIMAGYKGYICTYNNKEILKSQQIGSFIWYGITYGNGIYVAVGGDSNYQNGQATTSTDGINWTTPVKTGDNKWSAIAYANGIFVAVGCGNGGAYSATSTDGITWTTPIKASVNEWYGITYGNKKFVAVGSSGATATSTDGVNWTTPVKVSSYYLKGIIYVDGKFVAVGSRTSDGINSVHDGCIITSTDGVNWTTPVVVEYGLNAITYGNGKFVAAGFNGRVETSTDGVTWKIGYAGDNEVYWRAAAYVNNKFIIAGSATSNSIYGDAAASTNGEYWTGLGFDVNNIHSICVMQ